MSDRLIVFLIPHLGRGGAERVLITLAEGFKSRGFDVEICIFDKPVEYKTSVFIRNLNLRQRKGVTGKIYQTFLRRNALRKVYTKRGTTIISFINNVVPIFAGFEVIPSVRIDTRYSDEFSNKWVHWLFNQTVYQTSRVKKIVACSKGIQEMLNHNGVKNVITIYNPINLKSIKTSLSEMVSIEPKLMLNPFILSVGGLKTQKGFDRLLEAFSVINGDHNLVILGEGNDRSRLEGIVRKKGLENKVFLLGLKENPWVYMKKCDFFVLSSYYEGFPNVLIEALAVGTAVVSVDCPTGPNEIIQHRRNGLLVPNTVDGLVMGMKALQDDALLKNTLRLNAEKSVEKLELNSILDKWQQLVME